MSQIFHSTKKRTKYLLKVFQSVQMKAYKGNVTEKVTILLTLWIYYEADNTFLKLQFFRYTTVWNCCFILFFFFLIFEVLNVAKKKPDNTKHQENKLHISVFNLCSFRNKWVLHITHASQYLLAPLMSKQSIIRGITKHSLKVRRWMKNPDETDTGCQAWSNSAVQRKCDDS